MSYQITKQIVNIILFQLVFSFKILATAYTDIFFIDNNTGWVVGWPADGPVWDFMYKTEDGGQTWDEKGEDVFQNITARVQYIYFLNHQIGWMVFNPSAIFQTQDGGDTWDIINSDILPLSICFR